MGVFYRILCASVIFLIFPTIAVYECHHGAFEGSLLSEREFAPFWDILQCAICHGESFIKFLSWRCRSRVRIVTHPLEYVDNCIYIYTVLCALHKFSSDQGWFLPCATPVYPDAPRGDRG